MTLISSRLAPVGAALVIAGLLAGGATAQGQLVGDTRITGATPAVLTAPLPKLESVLAQRAGEGCAASNGVVFATGGAGYQRSGESLGTADVFGGATGLRLVGSRMAEVSGVVIILSDGRRITPRTLLNSCTDSQGRPSIRVTFDLPLVTTTTTARLQLTAPEPPPLITPPPPPPTLCRDPLTGESKPCPTLPTLPPKSIKVADLGLVLHPKPNIASLSPTSISAVGRSEVCRGRVRFDGQNLASAKLVADTGPLSFSTAVISQTATTIVADVTKTCQTGTVLNTIISGGVTLRRGTAGSPTTVIQCDTCVAASNFGGGFGGGAIRFSGPPSAP